jgi:hypothetical protein
MTSIAAFYMEPVPIMVQSILGSTLSGGVTTVTIPATQDGDLIVAFGSAIRSTPPTVTAGWTTITTYNNNPGGTGNDRATRVVWQRTTGNGQTLTFTGAGTSGVNYSGALIFRNAIGIGSYAATSATTTSGSTSFAAPAFAQSFSSSTVMMFGYVPNVTACTDIGIPDVPPVITNGIAYVGYQAAFAGATLTLSTASFPIGASVEIY